MEKYKNIWAFIAAAIGIITALLGIIVFIYDIQRNNYGDLKCYLVEMKVDMNSKFAEMKVDINTKFAEAKKDTDSRFNEINLKLVDVDKRLYEVDKRLYSVETVLYMKDYCVLKQNEK